MSFHDLNDAGLRNVANELRDSLDVFDAEIRRAQADEIAATARLTALRKTRATAAFVLEDYAAEAARRAAEAEAG